MRHRACDCPTRRHRLIRASASAAVLVGAVIVGLKLGGAVAAADELGRATAVTQVSATCEEVGHG